MKRSKTYKVNVELISDGNVGSCYSLTERTENRLHHKPRSSFDTLASEDGKDDRRRSSKNPFSNKARFSSATAISELSFSKFKETFEHLQIEELYQHYYIQTKRPLVISLLVMLMILCTSIFVYHMVSNEGTPEGRQIGKVIIVCIGGCASTVFFVISLKKDFYLKYAHILGFSIWLTATILINVYFGLTVNKAPTDDVPVVFYVICVCYIMFPLPKRVSVICGIFTGTFELILSGVLSTVRTEFLGSQLVSNFLLFGAANVIGLFHKYLSDITYRKAFLDARNSTETMVKLDREKTQQEDLLNSCIPTNMVEEMKSALIKGMTGKSPKLSSRDLLINQHENVSILYADIVNFTPLASDCTAAELVKTLNELFGRFDQLSRKYNCMRIKILGDCYNCASGLGQPDPNHAINCVNTGLHMIRVISDVRDATDVNVDMRIGIHSGTVYSGVLGRRKWQYDIWSDDVNIANAMEQSGQPGRIHISEETKKFLDNSFQIEECKELRCPLPKGMRTYLVIAPEMRQKNFTAVKLRKKYNGTVRASNRVSKYLERWGADKPFSSLVNAANTTTTSRVLSITSLGFLIPTSHIAESPSADQKFVEMSKKFQKQVNFQLIDKLNGLKKHRPWKKSLLDRLLLRFSDREIEYEFNRQEDTLFRFSVAVSMVIFVIQFCVQIINLPPSVVFIVIQIIGFILFMFFTFIYFVDCCMEADSKLIDILLRLTHTITKYHVTRLILALTFISIILVSAIISMTECNVKEDIKNLSLKNATHLSIAECYSSQYYIFCCLLAMTTCSVFLQISFVIKFIVMLIAVIVYNITFHLLQDKLFPSEEIRDENKIPLPVQATLYSLLMLISLHSLDRMIETTNRLDHYWKNQFEVETCKVKTTASLNKVLLENILPQHVAEYFLRDSNRKDLYHESYASVSVMFASIPSFQDVIMHKFSNRNSLDCLIFLHEIISTFDKLLSQATFMEVEKIKSIGSTYMAATGLFPDRETAETPEQERRNVVMMTKFALSMMVIIENWFNNFDKALTLRVGIMHGPVIAGVIGARKPVYDIWGDTVNVASRMDSTGVPGKIQVPDSTANILKMSGFKCELRGEISVKGKPPMKTHLVTPPEDQDTGFPNRTNRCMTL